MNSPGFQEYKVRKLIQRFGAKLCFYEPRKNEFGEPDGEAIPHNIAGVFHETSGYSSVSTSDASAIANRPSPMVLTLWKDAKILKQGWTLPFAGKTYTVARVKNVQEAGVAAEVSLEEVQADG